MADQLHPESLESYRQTVKNKLDTLMPVFAQVCAGDYSAKIPLPRDLDEFFDLYAGVQMTLDILGRQFKEFKDQLGFSKALLQAQSDLGHGLILADGSTNRLLYVNSALCKICGYTAPELFDAPSIMDIVAPEDRSMVLKNLTIRDYNHPQRFVTRIMHKNGPWIHVEVTLKRLEMGGHDKFIAVCRDISESKRIEDERLKLAAERVALRESEHKFREMADNAPVLIWMSGTDMGFDFFNRAWLEFTGQSSDQQTGEGWTNGLHPDDFDRVMTTYREAFQSRNKFVLEYRLKRHDGEFRWLMESGTPRFSANGQFTGYIGSCVDITDRKLYEEELAKARDAAVESTRVKSEFVANVSHEIRTPMNAIVGMTSLLLNTSLTDQQKDYSATIKNSCDTLLAIINDILDFSKMEAGHMSLETHDFDLKSLVESTVDILKLRAHAKGLELNCVLPADVPTALRGDAGRLRQVLMNLLANAVKFTDQGGISVNVSCENETGTQARVLIGVTDTGIGITPKQLSKLFQPFAQADAATTRKYGGTGLGLAISKRFVDLMGGEIGADSAEGQGSTFWFKIKFDKQPAKKTAAPSVEPIPLQLVQPHRDQPRVLVAEDNSVNQKVILLQLQQLGYRAHVVSNGVEAVAAAGEAKYDLLLMDCQMPDMDGYTATAKIREAEPKGQHIPIIAMTANAMSDDRKRCLQSGMDDYLSKPIKTEDLAAMLGRWNRADEDLSEKEFKLPGGLNNPEIVREVANLFLEKAPQHIAAMLAACEQEDWTALRIAAHTMQGGSATLGLKSLTLLVRRIEEMAYFGRTAGLKPVIDEMVREFTRLKAKISAVVGDAGKTARAA